MNNGVEDARFVHELVLSVVDVWVVSAHLLILQSLSWFCWLTDNYLVVPSYVHIPEEIDVRSWLW